MLEWLTLWRADGSGDRSGSSLLIRIDICRVANGAHRSRRALRACQRLTTNPETPASILVLGEDFGRSGDDHLSTSATWPTSPEPSRGRAVRTSAPSSNLCLSMSGRLPQTGQPTPAWGATAVDEPDRVTRARERAAEAKAHELEAHRRAEELHEEAAVTLERLGRRDLAQAARGRAQRARELYAEALREQAEADERATGHDGK
jgi:hypothetical protein